MLRDGDGQGLREHLIETAARLIDQHGGAGLGVRDIARAAQVADGVLYNYFEDKEDLLARALLVHVGSVMSGMPPLPAPGAGTLAENLATFIDSGLAVLVRVMPTFAGLRSQPKVLQRFHAMVGGEAAFGAPGDGGERAEAPADGGAAGTGRVPDDEPPGDGPRGLPDMLMAYLTAEQRLGRVSAAADVAAAATLIVGAIHGQILPTVLFRPPGTAVTIPPGLGGRLAATILGGISPQAGHS
ncbi:MAG TPA: TetR/AcrR family transcriptional regulator [Streptosporangiaceae bacterium]